MLRSGSNFRPIQITRQRNNRSTNTKKWDALGQEFLTIWQQAHGAPDGAVSVVVPQNGLMILIENAFSQAELALARQSTDNLLQRYIDSLMRQLMPKLTTRVEQVVGQQIETTSITPNIEQNWMMVFMKFDEPQLLETNCNR